jgi:pyrroline-5-carboxylate reductase
MSRPRIVLIGGGNMARSLVGGLVAADHPPSRIRVTDPSSDKRHDLEETFGVETTADNNAAVADAEVVVLAVKPQGLHEVVAALAPALAQQRPLVVSIAAGVRERDISRWLGYSGPVVRCMPNTPALYQCGMTALYANEHTSTAQREQAHRMLATAGAVIWLDNEADMDTVTAVSGGGPAYFFLLMEALEAAARARGLSGEQARLLATQTAFGAARMAQEWADGPADLRARVTSRGGATAQALATLEDADFAGLMDRAVGAAAERARALGDDWGAN